MTNVRQTASKKISDHVIVRLLGHDGVKYMLENEGFNIPARKMDGDSVYWLVEDLAPWFIHDETARDLLGFDTSVQFRQMVMMPKDVLSVMNLPQFSIPAIRKRKLEPEMVHYRLQTKDHRFAGPSQAKNLATELLEELVLQDLARDFTFNKSVALEAIKAAANNLFALGGEPYLEMGISSRRFSGRLSNGLRFQKLSAAHASVCHSPNNLKGYLVINGTEPVFFQMSHLDYHTSQGLHGMVSSNAKPFADSLQLTLEPYFAKMGMTVKVYFPDDFAVDCDVSDYIKKYS